MQNMIDQLGEEYRAWLTREKLPQISCCELLHEDLTDQQRRKASSFYRQFELLADADDFQRQGDHAQAHDALTRARALSDDTTFPVP